jgi:hypothetical protein
MWDENKQQQLNNLRGREQTEALDKTEQTKLDYLLDELEQEEWLALKPALEESRKEQEQLQEALGRFQAQNAVLVALSERYADLLARAKIQLVGLQSEQRELRGEYKRVLETISE